MKRHLLRFAAGVVGLAVVAAGFFYLGSRTRKAEQEAARLVDYWVEHCVDKWRPAFQDKARASCEAEAEEWRYGNEPRFDWEGYEEAIEEHMQRTENTPECVASDEALRLCNEALSRDAK